MNQPISEYGQPRETWKSDSLKSSTAAQVQNRVQVIDVQEENSNHEVPIAFHDNEGT